MKSVSLIVASLLLASAAQAQAPAVQANPNAPVYVVSYIDVMPSAKAQAMNLLKQFRTSCAREDGNQRCEAVQRMEQQNEFALIEVWKDQKSFQAHANGSGNQLRERLKPLQASPLDQRVHTGAAVLPRMVRYREQIFPMIGAPYDERLYKILD